MFKVTIFKANGAIGRFHDTYEAETLAEVGAHVEFLNRNARFWGTDNVYSWYHQLQAPAAGNIEPPPK